MAKRNSFTMSDIVPVLNLLQRATDRHGRTHLHCAAYFGNASACKTLIGLVRVSLNAVDINGRTPLYYAVWQNKPACWVILLAAGADPRGADKNGVSVLHMAAYTGNSHCVQALLRAGANAACVEAAHWRSPLHLAAGKGNLVVVKILAATGLALDWIDRHGFTPLAYAICAGERECALALIQAGASLSLVHRAIPLPEWAHDAEVARQSYKPPQ